MNKYSNHTILILGSNSETAAVVQKANSLGLRTVVVNPFDSSPAKESASCSYNFDPTDSHLINDVFEKESIDGVLLGVSDPLLPAYYKICKENGLNCYVNELSLSAFSSKARFSDLCRQFEIQPVTQFGLLTSVNHSITDEMLPIVVKPVDSGASVGVSFCKNQTELNQGISKALEVSRKKQVIIEKAMNCDDVFVYYSFVSGKCYLSAIADRHKSKKYSDLGKVCLYADYPSRHTQKFIEKVDSKLRAMFTSMKIQDGVFGIQFFYDGDEFYAYDPGFRLQGEGPHVYLNHIYGIDQIRILFNFALGKNLDTDETSLDNTFQFEGKVARTIWVLGETGTISTIEGLDKIQNNPHVISIAQRLKCGDSITDEMIDTERQVIMRIYTVASSYNEIDSVNAFVVSNLIVEDKDGKNLIQDMYKPKFGD
jgi:formate-dependent phosphoribosylglycinamide formyltransferase (GAR transformylase)